MAIHLVEHFYAWEVVDVVKEWVRVLKPGGKLILECPDLELACKRFLNHQDKPSLTYWVLYGDPQHRDPLMCHKWGYTPQTLTRLMDYAGLSNIRLEPAEFHLGPIRDIRAVGLK